MAVVGQTQNALKQFTQDRFEQWNLVCAYASQETGGFGKGGVGGKSRNIHGKLIFIMRCMCVCLNRVNNISETFSEIFKTQIIPLHQIRLIINFKCFNILTSFMSHRALQTQLLAAVCDSLRNFTFSCLSLSSE